MFLFSDNKMTIHYEPESPIVENVRQMKSVSSIELMLLLFQTHQRSPSPEPAITPAPVYHQMSSSDLDFLDQLSSSKAKTTNNEFQSIGKCYFFFFLLLKLEKLYLSHYVGHIRYAKCQQ